jgi:hypothetical protein
MLFDLPKVAGIDPEGGVIARPGEPVVTVAVMGVNLVTFPAVQMISSPVFTPAVDAPKMKPTKQLAPAASAPGAAVGQVVVAGSGLMLPADDTEQNRSMSWVVAVTVTLPETEAPTRTVPKST